MSSFANDVGVPSPLPQDVVLEGCAPASSAVSDAAVTTGSTMHLVGALGMLDQLPAPRFSRALPDPFFVLDAQGRTIMLSDAWEAVTGVAVTGALGCSFASMVHEDDEADVRFQLSGLLSGVVPLWRGRFRMTTARRGSVWVEVHAAPSGLCGDGSLNVVGTLRDVTFAREYEQELQRLSLHDAVIDVPNRALLLDRLQRRCARFFRNRAPHFALAFVDLDDFADVNDRLGHFQGDQALRAAAARLTGAVRASDTVARFGGDEFAVVLDEVRDPHDALRVCQQICEAMRQPFMLEHERVELSCSIGVVTSDTSFETASDLVNYADEAMYESKQAGSVAISYTGSRLGPRHVSGRW